jgi:hypothetical protein
MKLELGDRVTLLMRIGPSNWIVEAHTGYVSSISEDFLGVLIALPQSMSVSISHVPIWLPMSDEGRAWMPGYGSEVEQALLSAYALHHSDLMLPLAIHVQKDLP